MSVREELMALRDEKNAAFLAKLTPTLAPETILGARIPALRSLARKLRGTPEAEDFLRALPHALFEENLLHALLLSEMKNFETCLSQTGRFLPFVDNWAVCDALRPKCFPRHKAELLNAIRPWLDDDAPFTRRFGLEMLMVHFLDGDFSPAYLDWAARTRGENYYVNMMLARFFATALAKRYEAALPVLAERRLEKWTHNKTIRKALESLRVTEEHKAYLKTLK